MLCAVTTCVHSQFTHNLYSMSYFVISAGYAAVNRLGALRSDHDIFQTFEGDNTVLLQQVCVYLLEFALSHSAPLSLSLS